MLCLGRGFSRVVAVERGTAAADLRVNTGAEVHHSLAERFCMTQLPELAPDLVLLNPPRAGCDAAVIDAIGRVAPRRIVYVSCNPSTLARDVARLGAGYDVARAVAVDALPQTHHVESFIILASRDSSTLTVRSIDT